MAIAARLKRTLVLGLDGLVSLAGRLRNGLRRLGFAGVCSLVLLSALILALSVPPPSTLATLSARTEYLKYAPQNIDVATFALPIAHARAAGGVDHCLTDLEVSPRLMRGPVEIVLSRGPGGALTILVDGPVSWTASQASGSAAGLKLLLDPADKTCAPSQPVRLPISGKVRVGDDAGGDGLLSGQMDIYARAIRRLWFVPLWRGPFQPDAIYHAQTFDIPAGAAIIGAFEEGDAAPREWWGFANVAFSSEDMDDLDARGFEVRLATSARVIKLVPPSPSDRGLAPDEVSVTGLARIAGDPNIQWLAGMLTLFLALTATLAQVLSLPRSLEPEADK